MCIPCAPQNKEGGRKCMANLCCSPIHSTQFDRTTDEPQPLWGPRTRDQSGWGATPPAQVGTDQTETHLRTLLGLGPQLLVGVHRRLIGRHLVVVEPCQHAVCSAATETLKRPSPKPLKALNIPNLHGPQGRSARVSDLDR